MKNDTAYLQKDGHTLTLERPISYLDEGAELPADRLELFFLLKKAVTHTITIARDTLSSRDGVRDAAVILARCARRLAVVAEALAEAEVLQRRPDGIETGN